MQRIKVYQLRHLDILLLTGTNKNRIRVKTTQLSIISRNQMLENLLKSMPPVKEDLFEYFEVSEHYDVSINTIPANTKVPPHTHEQDVYNFVFSGKLTFSLGDTQKNLKKDDWVYIAKDTVHTLEVSEDSVLLEFWKK